MIPFSDIGGTARLWLRLGALALVVVALGLPINDLGRYGVLAIAGVLIFGGSLSTAPRAWLVASAIVAVSVLAQHLWPAPRIEEGHNVFLTGERAAALQALPPDVYRFMAKRFDERYPDGGACKPGASGCWQTMSGPDRLFAFSADGLLERPLHSRRVAGIRFSSPADLNLGFVNDRRYNWYSGSSAVERGERVRGLTGLWTPWRVTMPFFLMYRFPEAFAESSLCWRGDAMWENASGGFAAIHHADMACRAIATEDAGRRIFALSIARDPPLAMTLVPTWRILFRQIVETAMALFAAGAVVLVLVRWRRPQVAMPFALIGLALVVTFFTDASLIGGIRPYDGGDDGLFYEGTGQIIAQHLANGRIALALMGEEAVFYYGGPGLRYFRAIERYLFGDTSLGHLLLLLAMPLIVFALFRRFFSARVAFALAVVFVAIPIGTLFGTSYVLYARLVARGFADPAAYILFIAGLLVLIGRDRGGPDGRFAPAVAAGLLFALALFMRPIIAPATAVVLTGAALAALWQGRHARVAGLCIGFLPAFGMALHNWYFGGVFVLFSSNAGHPLVYVTPPSVYGAALLELARLDVAGEHIARVGRQLFGWLSGDRQTAWAVPIHAAAVAVTIRVAFRGRGGDMWIRIVAFAVLAQHLIGLTHVDTPRYHYLAWFLSLLIVMVWMRDEGWDALRRRAPAFVHRVERGPVGLWTDRILDDWAWIGGLGPRVRRRSAVTPAA